MMLINAIGLLMLMTPFIALALWLRRMEITKEFMLFVLIVGCVLAYFFFGYTFLNWRAP